MRDEDQGVASLRAADAATDERMHVFAIRCGVKLDPEEDPVTFANVRRAAADDCTLRAAIVHAPRVLPDGLAKYLVRSWEVHTQTFDRVREMSELEFAAGWARRHAIAARSVLSMQVPSQPPTSEASPQ